MNKPKPQRCFYKGNGCRRTDLHETVLNHMCEGSMYFKCHEYLRLQNAGQEPVPDEVYDARRDFLE